MYLELPLLLLCLTRISTQGDTEDNTANLTSDNAEDAEPTTEERIPTTLEFKNLDEDIKSVEKLPTEPPFTEEPPQPQPVKFQNAPVRSRPAFTSRRRPRRQQHGFFNDARYRNPANNPNNPNSPYAFRGRPGQPPHQHQQQQPPAQQYYDPRYYDPYSQAAQDAYNYAYAGYYYGYPPPNYAPYAQHQQQPYPPKPYPPQPFQPPPPTYQPPPAQPPTEQIPELYYLQTPDTPDGQYQYKKMSVRPEVGWRRRPQRQQQPPHPAYNNPYPYNPYDPYNRQAYYQQDYGQNQYQQQGYNYPPYEYQRPRGARSPRKLRGGLPPRPTPDPRAWKLTTSPERLDLADTPTAAAPDLADVPPAPANTLEDASETPPTTGAGE